MNHGLDIINAVKPATNWTLDTLPIQLREVVLLAEIKWQLTAQQIINAELSFDGPSVSLLTSEQYETVISSIDTAIREFAGAKTEIVFENRFNQLGTDTRLKG